jgi:hypothetical protein
MVSLDDVERQGASGLPRLNFFPTAERQADSLFFCLSPVPAGKMKNLAKTKKRNVSVAEVLV